jgi:hypothetical protein
MPAEREAGSTSVIATALNRVGEAHMCNVWAVGGNATQDLQRLGLGSRINLAAAYDEAGRPNRGLGGGG